MGFLETYLAAVAALWTVCGVISATVSVYAALKDKGSVYDDLSKVVFALIIGPIAIGIIVIKFFVAVGRKQPP